MGIARFDDGCPNNPKLIQAGPVAAWLWFCGICYCRTGVTDGFIPKGRVPGLVVNLQAPFKHAARLVEVGLWEDVEGGYRVHDYHHFNPSKATIEEYRRRDRERKQKRHGLTSTSDSRSDSTTDSDLESRSDSARSGLTRAGATSAYVSEYKSEDRERGESAREGSQSPAVPPVWRRPGETRSPGLTLTASHVRCLGIAAAACAVGMCVPAFLVSREWLPQVGGRELAITEFIASVLIAEPEPKGDPLQFWRAKWAEKYATPRRLTSTREGRMAEAAARTQQWLDGGGDVES